MGPVALQCKLQIISTKGGNEIFMLLHHFIELQTQQVVSDLDGKLNRSWQPLRCMDDDDDGEEGYMLMHYMVEAIVYGRRIGSFHQTQE